MAERVAVLVLMDEGRAYYVILRAVLERARATEEQRAAIEQALTGDVSGRRVGAPGVAQAIGPPSTAPSLLAPVGLLTLSTTVVANLFSSPGGTAHRFSGLASRDEGTP